MSYIDKEKLIKADIASIENRVRHAFNQGYDLGYKEGKANRSEIPTGSTTKNNLGVDLISRADVLKLMQDNWHTHNGDWAMQESMDDIRALPLVTPQEPQSFKWCETCKEYDTEKHCCHRFSKVNRDTVEEIRQEPILDKIRTEIDAIEIYGQIDEHTAFIRAGEQVKQMALDIIDKYKAETEK